MSGGGQIAEFYHAIEQSGAKVVIIDPRRTDSITGFHSEWLPIRSGTDTALVAGMIHPLIKEDVIDEGLVNKYAIGWDENTLPDSAPANASYNSGVNRHILNSCDTLL